MRNQQKIDSMTFFSIGAIGYLTIMFFLVTCKSPIGEPTETKLNSNDTIYITDTVIVRDTVYIHYPKGPEKRDLINAICMVESSGIDSAYNAKEDAVGILQIRQCMVNDVNRILGRRGIDSLYSMEDRWCPEKSLQMFNIFISHYNLTEPEEIARCWNGGPRGMSYTYTEPYWDKVLSYLNDTQVLDEDV
jgi:hypothetical protein